MLWRATRRGHASEGESCRGAGLAFAPRRDPRPPAREGCRLSRRPKLNLGLKANSLIQIYNAFLRRCSGPRETRGRHSVPILLDCPADITTFQVARPLWVGLRLSTSAMRALILAPVAIALASGPVIAAAPSAKQLIAAYQQADEGCRGSPGDSGIAECDRRSRLSSRLNQIGWCYGTKSQSRSTFDWHHCTANSLMTTDLQPDAR